MVDAAGIKRFALLGISQGCAISIAYAVRHPERVSHLVLYGGFATGWNRRARTAAQKEEETAMLTLMRVGWGKENPAFRQIFTSQFIPGGTKEQADWFNELQRLTVSGEMAARIHEANGDTDVTALKGRELRQWRARCAMIFQQFNLLPRTTALENVEMPLIYHRMRSSERRRRALTLLEEMGLSERARHTPAELSGGEQQQLAVAKALVVRPRLLCIDELSLGLAPAVVGDLLEMVQAVRSQGTTLLLVEQSLNVAASTCERALFLEKGRVRFEGAPAELLERGDLARAVFVRESVPKGARNMAGSRRRH